MFHKRGKTIAMVDASIDMFVVFYFMRGVRKGKQKGEVFCMK